MLRDVSLIEQHMAALPKKKRKKNDADFEATDRPKGQLISKANSKLFI